MVESYTMFAINADAHPLMNRMHRPDPKRPAHMKDKGSVIPIALVDADAWLTDHVQQAATLMELAPTEDFEAAPAAG